MMHKAWCSTEEVPLCFSRSSIKFEDHMDRKIRDLNPILRKITRLVAAIKSLRFALFEVIHQFQSHTGWKIDDLNPIWVRLLGRSHLSNSTDLPCLKFGRPFVAFFRTNWANLLWKPGLYYTPWKWARTYFFLMFQLDCHGPISIVYSTVNVSSHGNELTFIAKKTLLKYARGGFRQFI